MDKEYKLKISTGSQFKNLAVLLTVSVVYYGVFFFFNENFYRVWYSHLLIIVLLIPTLGIHISYLIENFGDEYVVRKNAIVDVRRNIEYDKNAIRKIEIHKYLSLPQGNHFLPFHCYKFCRIVLKDNNSFVISSLMKYNIDAFLKEKVEGVLFESHHNYFPIV